MLGVVGFVLAAVAISGFAWTAYHAYTTLSRLQLNAFCAAFGMLAIAMVLWAIIVAAPSDVVTATFMLAADTLLIIGTACMMIVIFGEVSPFLLAMLGGIVSMLVAWRAFIEPTTAYVQKGILYFNLQGSARLFIVGLFALIWLPAMMIVGNRVANDALLTRRRFSLQMYFVLLVALMATFAKARRTEAIIFLFGAIIFVFLLALLFNVTLKKAHDIELQSASAKAPITTPKKRTGHATR